MRFFLFPAKTWKHHPFLLKVYQRRSSRELVILKFQKTARRRKTAAGSRHIRIETKAATLGTSTLKNVFFLLFEKEIHGISIFESCFSPFGYWGQHFVEFHGSKTPCLGNHSSLEDAV